MKVLMLNGSPRANGSTYTALGEVASTLAEEGIDSEIVQIGTGPIYDCRGCRRCRGEGCVVDEDDGVNAFIAKALESDGFVFGTPVYYAHPSGCVLSFLDRVFYSSSKGYVNEAFAHKPGAVVVAARRGGTAAAYDVLNKYFGILQMPQVGSTYWNMVYGTSGEEVLQDAEGVQTMHNIAHNMAWLLRLIDSGKKAGINPPAFEYGDRTNFIR